jgi:gliding motility-associated-like protein
MLKSLFGTVVLLIFVGGGLSAQPCNLTDPGIGVIFCDDNGTPGDPNIHSAVVELNPTGTGLGTFYTVTSPGLLVSPGAGSYGMAQLQELVAAGPVGPNLTITITDNDDPSCSITFTIPNPAPCSPPPSCNLTSSGLGIAQCNDNGTPGDASDDFYTFPLDPQGTGLGSGYTVSPTPGTLMPTGGTYGGPTIFTLSGVPPGSGVQLIITDNDDPSCQTNTIINPPPCAPPSCTITDPGIGSITCDQFGTPTIPGDDFAVVELNPTGTGLGTTYIVTSPEVIATPGFGTYGSFEIQELIGAANAGPDITLTITDSNDPNCSITFTIPNPAPCATQPCNINFSQVGNIVCDDNGTPSDPSDDTFTFVISVTGTGTGSGWTTNDPLNTSGSYDVVTTMGPYPLSVGSIDLVATDNDDPSCSTITIVVVAPPPCSSAAACDITASGLANIICVENGTPGNPNDDFVQFTLNPTGTGLGTLYDVSISPGNITPQQGNYGSPNSFITDPGSGSLGDFTITITDQNDPSCSFTFPLVNPCTSNCFISAIVSTSVCNDNGSPSDPSDDTFTFDVTVSGTGTGSSWSANDPNSTTGNYNVPTSFGPYPISGGTLFLTLTDGDDPNCITTFSVSPPPPCSTAPPCNITDEGLSNVLCNVAGTPGDPSDDYVQFSLDPTGSGLGATYDVFISPGTVNPTQGTYGFPNGFITNPGSGSLGDFTVTIIDQNDPSCSFTFTLVNPCSALCSITAVPTTPVCDDNGTPSDPSDDTFSLEVTLTGANTGPGWSADDPNATTGSYNTPVTFGPYPIAGGPFVITITDDNDPGCTTTFPVVPPPPCSDACILQAANLANVVCVDAGTPLDPMDDFIQFSLNPTGQNLGAFYNVSASAGTLVPPAGSYGAPSTFQTSPGTAGIGDIVLTIIDFNDPACSLTITLPDPGVCSTPCDISLLLQNVECQDNGTPTDPADDLFTATILVNGTGTGWTADDPAGSTGVFGQTVTVGSFPISGGPATVTFTNLDDAGCQESLLISPPPPCSGACDVQTTVANIVCDDNGTPGDNSDDTFTALLTVTGINTGPVWTAGPPANTTGTYGVPTTVGPFPGTQPTVSFLVADGNDPNCNTLVTITSPGGCSTGCPAPDSTLINTTSCNPLDTGVVSQTFTNSIGCDSVVITTTSLLPSDTTLLFAQSCNPQDTGTVQVLLTNLFGCDSLVISTTSFELADTTLLFAESCNPQDTGTVEVLLSNQFGCDSLVITETSLLTSDTTLLFAESCNPQDTGTVEVLLSNQFGCDSLVITETSLLTSDTTLLFAESCNPQDTGTVEVLLANQFGCDSLVITQTSLLPSDTILLFAESCNPQDTGTVEVLFTNQFGCDSLVITQTSLLPSDTLLLFAESCNPQDTGTVEVLFANQFGCDSLVITQTSLLTSDTILLFAESCNPQDTGTVEVLFANQFGCDSLVITQTSLLPSDTILLFAESCNPQDTGTVEVLFANQFGCDSLVITTTNLLPIAEDFLFFDLCFGDSLIMNGTVYNAANPSGVDTLVAANGCDSLVFVELQLAPLPEFMQIDTLLCEGEQLLVNGQVYDADSPAGTQVFSGQNGCDSLVIEVSVAFNELAIIATAELPDCAGLPGQIIVQAVTGGSFPYSVQLDGQPGLVADSFPLVLEGLFPGEYSVQLTDELGCTSTESLLVPEGLEPVVDLGEDISISLGENSVLEPQINFVYDSLLWSPPEAVSCVDCPAPELAATETVTISLLAFTETGCLAEDQLEVRVSRGFSYFAPNAFSPDANGINDYFTLYADARQVVRISRLTIFDRWGDQVFEAEDIQPGIETEGWDGRFRRQILNPAVFVYYAELELIDGRTELVKGEVLLVR